MQYILTASIQFIIVGFALVMAHDFIAGLQHRWVDKTRPVMQVQSDPIIEPALIQESEPVSAPQPEPVVIELPVASPQPEQPKRKRGRPRKIEQQAVTTTPKKRGRPKKAV